MKRVMTVAALAVAMASGVAGAAPMSGLNDGVYSPRADAPVLQPVYYLHTCTARSRVAYGYWSNVSLAVAKLRALRQCAIRTPRGLTCFITACT